MTDWLPGKREDRLAMAKEWINVLRTPNPDAGPGQGAAVTMADKWGVPQAVVEELDELTGKADIALANIKNKETRNAVTIAICDEAFDALTAKMRYIKDRYFKKPPLADHDFASLSLNPKDNVRTEHIEVHERVALKLGLRYSREARVDFTVLGATNKAKPDGYEGAEIIWAVLDHPPASHAELTCHDMASRTPYYIKFADSERGKTVYVSAAWRNERGIRGDYGEIASAVVP